MGVVSRVLRVATVLAVALSGVAWGNGARANAQGGGADARPLVLVHGSGGSAADFGAQVLRFTSNGFRPDLVAALEYDSTFSTATLADVHRRLDELVARLRQAAGASGASGDARVDVLAHGLGTFVVQTYLASSDARAGAVARYVNVDGGAGATIPEPVEALAVWGPGDPGRHIAGARNVRVPAAGPGPGVARSARTFELAYRFLTGRRPATTRVVPQPDGPITVAGRALVRLFNVGLENATLEIHRLGPTAGGGGGGEPVARFALDAGGEGAWGPFTAEPGRRYRFVIAREDGTEDLGVRGPFVRSDHLVRLATDRPGPDLGARMVNALAAGSGYVSTPGSAAVPSPERQPSPLDCEGPVPDPEPGTAAWFARDANNLFCSQQRHLDQVSHPVTPLPTSAPGLDAYRDPARHDGVRFRYDRTTVAGLDTEVYRPAAAEPPYPAVVVLHGGGSRKELHWWASQALAEAGYMTIAFDGANLANARRVLDWLFAGDDPLTRDFDGTRVGVAGHSIGGDAAAALAHGDPRVSAVVYWDRAGLSSPPPGELRVPALALVSDYGCTAPLVCPLEPRSAPPDPADRGAKLEDFDRLREAGIDTMQVALRAVTHFDFVVGDPAGNRYGELASVYFTRAWFDRYVRGASEPQVAADAHRRLTARVFDRSADRHNLSQGRWSPAAAAASPDDPYAGNVPYALAGTPVADRLSFYYSSRCWLSVPGSGARATSDDVRSRGCR